MFEHILNKIKPSKDEEINLLNKVNSFCKILQELGLEIMIGGSVGKGTWLKGTSDVDIYVLYKDDKNISDKLESKLKQTNLSYIRVQGSRDYFKVFFEDLEFELIPILKIDSPEKARNVTDLSPFHVKYVKSKIKENKFLADEIRLTKAFFKSIGVYGAESYINGFSGYVCEVITIYYKSFMNLVKDAVKWRPKVVIDVENFYPDTSKIFEEINKDKLKSPIIVIDPVYKERNIASAVNCKSFSKLIFYCRRLLENLSSPDEYFITKKKNLDYAMNKKSKMGTKLLYISLKGRSNNKDVANTKILKFSEMLCKVLSVLGFVVLDVDLKFQDSLEDKAELFVYYYPESLPKYEKKLGPPVWVYNNAEKFYNKWRNYEVKFDNSGRIIILAPRRIYNISEAIEFFFNKYKDSINNKVEILQISYF